MSDEKRPLYGGMGMLDAFLAIDERKREAVAAEKRAAEIASRAGQELRERVAELSAQLTDGRALTERLIAERDQLETELETERREHAKTRERLAEAEKTVESLRLNIGLAQVTS